MKLVSKTLPLIAVAMLVAIVAVAQGPTGQVHGKVTDKEGKPLAGLTVTFDQTSQGTSKSTTKTDAQGVYRKDSLAAGEYRVSLTDAKGTVVTAMTTKVSTGGDATLDFDIRKLAGDAEAQKAAIEAENKAQLDLRAIFKQGADAFTAKNYEDAAKFFGQAVQIDPKQDVIFANLGEAYNMLRKYDDAAAAYQKAIELKPADANYYMNLGVVLGNGGKVEEAQAALAKSAELSPANASQAYYNLGAVLTNRNKLPDALTAFTKATEFNPNNADAFFQLGVTYIGMSKMAESIPSFQKYLALAPKGQLAEAAQQMIDAAKTAAPASFKSDAALAEEQKAADAKAKAQQKNQTKQKKGQ